MAYSLALATTQSISTNVGDNPAFGTSGSFSARVFFTNPDTSLPVIGYYNTVTPNSQRHIRYFSPGNSSVRRAEGNTAGNQFSFDLSAGSMPQSTWQTVASTRASNSVHALYTDGVSATSTQTISGTQTVDVFRVGSYTGRVAEVAVWSVELTADEVTSLIRGFKPTRIRPQSLLLYAPLVRDIYDYRAGRTLNNNNSATIIEHPRVY
jgi:hypothetical protein